MENNPKKSKALIITIIFIIFLLIIGFLAYKNRNNFGEKTSRSINKIFSPLIPSENSKNLKTVDENSERIVAQAGEDIKAGDNLSLAGTNTNNNPIVIKASNGSSFYGFANQDILNGELGEVIINPGTSGGFFETFSNFLNNLFGNTTGTSPPLINETCLNGATNPPICTINTNNVCVNGATNPPICTLIDGECLNGATNPPICTINTNNVCVNGATNPPVCTFDFTYQCSDNLDNDSDGLIDQLDPNCHTGGNLEGSYVPNHNSEADNPCENGATNPPLCTIFEEEKLPDLTAGTISPTNSLTGTPATISVLISNIGNGNTGYNFSSFFTITNQKMTAGQLESNDNIISKSKFKNIISKIFNINNWISRVKANTTENANIIINENIAVVTPQINAGKSESISTSYVFKNAGIYYIRACADKNSINDNGVIPETNEDNNCGPWTVFEVTTSLPPPGELPQCSDGKDNDRDNLIDDLDPNCHIDGDLTKAYIPSHNNESRAPSVLSECNDNVDNDGDNLIDINDPACHLGGDITKDYIAEHDSELTPPVDPNTQTEENICLAVQQNPLVFTDQEKSELAELLRKFYLLAPNLKTEDDISLIYNEIEKYDSFSAQLSSLINQCNYETNLPSYTGPKTKYGNPWYKYTERGFYINDANPKPNSCVGIVTMPEKLPNGDPNPWLGTDCSSKPVTNEADCIYYAGLPGDNKYNGCFWLNYDEYEAILNVW